MIAAKSTVYGKQSQNRSDNERVASRKGPRGRSLFLIGVAGDLLKPVATLPVLTLCSVTTIF
jgi:hypothetical protein